jgi:hypothetical protein
MFWCLIPILCYYTAKRLIADKLMPILKKKAYESTETNKNGYIALNIADEPM